MSGALAGRAARLGRRWADTYRRDGATATAWAVAMAAERWYRRPRPLVLRSGSGRDVLRGTVRWDHRRHTLAVDEVVDATAAPGAVLTAGVEYVATSDGALAERLRAAGAALARHSLFYVQDYATNAVPGSWAGEPAPGGCTLHDFDASAAELLPLWAAAFGPGHVDHDPRGGRHLLHHTIEPLLRGESLGPLHPGSLTVREHGRLRGAGIVTVREGEPPMGGAWGDYMFRDPDPAYAGLGTYMLRQLMVRVQRSGAGHAMLAVTSDNPALRLYERMGLTPVQENWLLRLPGWALG